MTLTLTEGHRVRAEQNWFDSVSHADDESKLRFTVEKNLSLSVAGVVGI